MKNLLLFFTIIFMFQVSEAMPRRSHDSGRIKGIVVDKASGAPLEFSTVYLIDSLGKVAAVSTTDNKGNFTLLADFGAYSLKVSYIGYADTTHTVSISADNSDQAIGEIPIESDVSELEAVVISGRKPVIERQIDKLVMNVSNTIAAANNTALELLRKAPGISIDREGNINLNGKNVQVWIDNRPSNLSGQDLVALLDGTEGSSIDKIEIIDNPSSKYDAEGSGGIINIKTKKNFMNGFNGSLRATYSQYMEEVPDYLYRANGALNLNYRNDLINTYVNYSTIKGKDYTGLSEDISSQENITDGSDSYARYSDLTNINRFLRHNIKSGIDFFINKKNIMGAVVNLSFRESKDQDSGLGWVGPANTPTERYFLESEGNNPFQNKAVNLNYTRYFEESGNELTANMDYMDYYIYPDQYNNTQFQSIITKQPDIFRNNSTLHLHVYSAKLDYTKALNETMNLEAGGKIAQSNTDSKILRQDSTDTGWNTNTRLSNDFEYRELISALYASYTWKISPVWNIKAGMRWENTFSKGIWKTAGNITSQHYNDFFPTLFLGYNPSEKHSFSLSYTRRLRRPNYNQLNPFRRYFSSYSFIEGNPFISPEYSDNVNLSYTAFHYLNISCHYSYRDGMIIQVPQFDNTNGETGYVQGNFGYNNIATISVSLSELPLTKWWMLTLHSSGLYNKNKDNTYEAHSWGGDGYINQTFILGNTWKAELEGEITSPFVWGYYHIKTNGSVNAGIQKTLYDNNLSLSLYVDDIFKTRNENLSMTREGIVRKIENEWTTRSIRFTISYRFGQKKNGVKQRKVGIQEESERIE